MAQTNRKSPLIAALEQAEENKKKPCAAEKWLRSLTEEERVAVETHVAATSANSVFNAIEDLVDFSTQTFYRHYRTSSPRCSCYTTGVFDV